MYKQTKFKTFFTAESYQEEAVPHQELAAGCSALVSGCLATGSSVGLLTESAATL